MSAHCDHREVRASGTWVCDSVEPHAPGKHYLVREEER